MFNSTVLEVAIGVCFTFAAVSLLVSSLNEALASLFKLRAMSLLNGIKAMLNDPHFTGLALDLYNHALVNPRSTGTAKCKSELTHRPSYVDSHHFALALIESIESVHGTFEALGKDIDGIGNPQLRTLLRGMYARAGGRVEVLRRDIAAWFDSGMERVGGAYKRRAQLISFGLGLLIAMLLNVDAIHLFRVLWIHPGLAAQLGGANPTLATEAIKQLEVLPVGWEQFPPSFDLALLSQVCGWLITASSALFGAPFWFDILQRFVQLRGTGKPASSKEPRSLDARGV